MGIMLSLQEVTKIYPGAEHIKAVDSLSFDLEEGEICTMVGPSGCGKTTAMKMVNRLIPITSGKILIDDQNINRLDTIELRRSIGYVIQNIGLFPNMTIAENIATIPKLKGWDHDQIAEKVEGLLEIVNLPPEDFMDRYPRELSGGQQQRIGVARGMAADPPIMLMDEPFGAIDPINREHLQDEFLKIQAKVKKTIVFVTHDIDEAIKMGDKICLLRDGKLVQFASPEELLTEPANDFVRDFVGGDRTLKRLNLLKIRTAMKPDTPVIMQTESPEKAKSMLRELNLDHLIVVDNEKRLVGYVDKEALTKKADEVGNVTQSTNAFLPASSSLKDGLSEIFTHDLGYLIVVDEDKKVLGTLREEEIKDILRK
ncbi:MAG: ABC transporter ATP-binding protein [Thermodesulfobacteriota bacterium]|nr:ABC transporter ATP-binding protein [Thermodesulfobacteriota bacterium]